jgi:hypothetical protein
MQWRATALSRGGIGMHGKISREDHRQAGFMLAPILYMLALAGVGAAVMFSGYSQVLRSNAEMTAVNAVRSQLQSAGQTLSASSVLDSATSSIVLPPAAVAYASVVDTARLPGGYNDVGNTGTPTGYGVIGVDVGVRQLDPWGKYYVYCRWENPVSSPALPALMVLSGGPDGALTTHCGDANATNDDRIIKFTVAEAINRANVWQVSSSSQVKFGIDSNAVRVNQDGSLTANSLTLSTALAIAFGGTGATTASGARTNLSVPDYAGTGATGTWGISVSGNAGTATALETARNISIAGASGLTASAVPFDGTADATLSLAGTLALSNGGTGATTASDARTNLGATTVGDEVFTAADAGAARTALGAGTTGSALFTSATPADARTTLGLGTMSTQDADSVAITGGTISGVDLTGSTIPGANVDGSVPHADTADQVPASGIQGTVQIAQGGTGAVTALAALAALGGDNASNLIQGTLNWARLPTISGVAGSYTWGDVNQYGLVTAARNVTSNGITEGNSGIVVDDNGSDGNIVFSTEGNPAVTIDNQGRVGIGTTLPGEKLDVVGNIRIRNDVETIRSLIYGTGTSPRWAVSTNDVAEGGSNVGSNFVITRFGDNGSSLGNALAISRADGTVSIAGDLSVGGTITATGGFYGTFYGDISGTASDLSLNDGLVTAPALRFTADTDTGLYRPGDDIFGIAAGGRDAARFIGSTSAVNYFTLASSVTGQPIVLGSAGGDSNIGITLSPKGTGAITLGVSSSNPTTVAGALTAASTLDVTGNATFDTNTLFVDAANNRVGIGTLSPAAALDVNGSGNIVGALVIGTDLVVDTNTLVVDSTNNRVGIGTGTPGTRFELKETKADTAAGQQIMNNSVLTVNPGGTSSTSFLNTVNGLTVAPTANTTSATATTSYTNNTGSGTLASGYGLLSETSNSGTGAITSAYGAYNRTANSRPSGTGISNAWGSTSIVTNSSTGDITTAVGAQNQVLNSLGGTVTTAYGAYNYVQNASSGTVTTAYGSLSRIANDNVNGDIGTAISLQVDLLNSGDVTDWYGIYVPAVTGNAPATARFPLYVADTGINYMAGILSLGDTTPTAGVSLDIGTKTDSVLLPKGLDGDRPTGVAGMLRYNTTANKLEYRNATTWVQLSDTAAIASSFIPGTETAPGLYVTTDIDTGLFQAVPDTLSVATGGVEAIRFTGVANAVNYVDVSPAASGDGPVITVSGDDTDIDLNLKAKGNGSVTVISQDAASKVFHVRGAVSQTGNLQEWQNDSGTPLALIDAAGRLGIGTSSVAASAIFELNSTTQGFLPPRMDTTQRDAILTPATGLTVFNTTTGNLSYFNGSIWASPILTETDPQVGTLTASKWCTTNAGGTAIDCTQDSPATPPAGPTGAVQYNNAGVFGGTANLFWDISNGRLGIGTDTPVQKLEVAGTTKSNTVLFVGITGGAAPANAGGTSSSWMIASGDTYLSTGNLGIGTTTPSYKLDVRGGVVAGAGAYVNTSDMRLKTNVQPIAYGLDTVMKMRAVGFDWKQQDEEWRHQHQIGFIAQEVEKLIPEVVTTASDEIKTKSLAYGSIVPVLTKAIQDLKALFDSLVVKLNAALADIAKLFETTSRHEEEIKALRDELKTLHEEFKAYKAAHP